jgi:hypothetical protein
MTIKIFNDEPPGGAYIFPVFTTGGVGFRERLKAWFCVDGPYTATKLSRIYINPSSGIPPGQSVTLQIPLYTLNTPGMVLPDQYIDWWTGDTIELFYSSSATPPKALKELVMGIGPDNPNQQSLPPVAGLPTCNGCVEMQFFVDTASITKNNPSQLIEFNLGALQACSDPNNPLCKPPRPPGFNALDTRNVDIDVSYVNVAFGPATLAPFQNDQTGYVGTPQPAENFSMALSKFLISQICGTPRLPSCNGWPQFVHTYHDGTKEILLKLASPLEVFSRLSPTPPNPPPDLCGFTPQTACSTQQNCTNSNNTGCLLWPGILWPPIQQLLLNFVSHAGEPNAPGACGIAPSPGTFCAALMDVKTLLIRNYNNYVVLANQRGCPPVPLNHFTLIAHVYQWSPFVERNGAGSACLGATDNLLQNTPIPGGGAYSDNNSALYQQVKLEFDKLNYNLLTDNNLPYNFNPWVGCQANVNPPCHFNGLIHGSDFVNAPNVYAYSVDDAVGNLQSEGGGFIIDVGSSKNLCTGATPCPNQNPAGPPVNVNLALNSSFQFNMKNYGVCKFDPTDPVSYKPINTLASSFIINPSNPQQCPVFLVDSKSPPQLYTFTVTTPPARAPAVPPPFSLQNGVSPTTAAVIDCSGNKGTAPPNPLNAQFQQSSATWCCVKLNPPDINGVWARSVQDTTDAHKSFQHFVITNAAQQSTSDSAPTCNMGQ